LARRLADSRAGISLLSALAALAVSGALTATIGVSPLDAYGRLWEGSLGSTEAVGTTFVKSLPLVLTALGFVVALRCGLWNIGMEGQLYAGAVAAAVVGANVQAPAAVHLPLTVLASAAAGALWASIPAVLKVWRDVNEIVSSLFLNYVAILGTSWLLAGPLKAEGAIYPQTAGVAETAMLPTLFSGTRIHAGLVVALLGAVLVWLLLQRSVLGYELRTVGASVRVARYAGIDVRRAILVAFAVSGALAGLAGCVEILGNQLVLQENFSPGWGYTGIAAGLLGGGTVIGAVAAGTFFGVLSAGADELQYQLEVPASFALVVQATAVIFVLAGPHVRVLLLGRRSRRRARAAPPPVAAGGEAT
jgi:general nucleoside transport system permease protein